MRVERCSAVNPDAPVFNIHVDENNDKWVSNGEGLFKVHAADLSTPVDIGMGEQSLLSYPGGNADIRWMKGSLNKEIDNVIRDGNRVTAAFYNEIQDHLWIGTSESGVFMFRTQPNLKWIKEINRRMPKLHSSKINMIFIDAQEDRHFIGTDQGVAVGKGGRWGLEERYYRFEAITTFGSEVWLLAEDQIWVVDEKDRWRSINVDQEQIEGEIKDIAFDKDGHLWIASELLTVWDVENDKYRIFDGADYFTSNDVNTIAVDKKGAVWVGTQDKGLYVIEKESAMTVTALAENEVSCDPSVNDGSLIVKIKGGQPPYTYAWPEGLAGENPKNLAPGSYIVTVTDAAGQSSRAEGLLKDTRLKVAVEQNAAASNGKKGGAKATIEGGTPKYSYQWDNGEIGPVAKNLEAGTHFMTVTDSKGCQASGSVEIGQEVGELALTLERTGISKCANDQLNAVTANIQGGLGPYELKWSDPSLTGREVQGVKGGVYFLTVTDSRGTTAEANINIPTLKPLVAKARSQRSASIGKEDGRASVSIVGGTEPYQMQWDNGETKKSASNLSSGSHTVTVTDDGGCEISAEVVIEQEVGKLAVYIEQTGTSACAGDKRNQLTASILGGQEPYQLAWSDPSLSSEEVNGLSGGVYFLTVTDAQGKTADASINIPTLKELTLEAMVNSDASTNTSDGRATVNVKGGTEPYSYKWDNGEEERSATGLSPGVHTVSVTDAAGCTAQSTIEIKENISDLQLQLATETMPNCFGDQTGVVAANVTGGKGPYTYTWNDPSLSGIRLEGLKGGSFSLTVTDVAGNEATASVAIDEPQEIIAEVVEQRGATDESTNDGKAQIEVSGGKKPYSIVWDNGYKGEKVENLSVGQHSVTITDANSCEMVKTFETKQRILPQLSMSKLRAGQVVQMQMLQFDADSTNIKAAAEPILNEVYEFLKDNPGVVIRVEGHTNNVPPDDYCDRISTARAKSVAEYVVQQGVAGERVYYRGYGKRQPKYSNRTAEGRRKNQRVEINILSINEDG
ncbi:MAG: OmpA family protein [Saprospiraceae bacterium]|nr:OmpA family protein [Saprospiraceae bacterium]